MSDKLIEAVARELHHAGWEKDYWTEAAKQVIAAIEASGYAVVPKEPTTEMLSALYDIGSYDILASDAYAAMLSARPKVTA